MQGVGLIDAALEKERLVVDLLFCGVGEQLSQSCPAFFDFVVVDQLTCW